MSDLITALEGIDRALMRAVVMLESDTYDAAGRALSASRMVRNAAVSERIDRDDLKTARKLFLAVAETFSGAVEDTAAHINTVRGAVLAEIERQKVKREAAEHSLTDRRVRDFVFGMTDGRCSYCDVELVREMDGDEANRPRLFCIEHVVPQAAGGPNHIKNYVPSCWSCNTSKRDRHVLTFIRKRFGRDISVLEAAE